MSVELIGLVMRGSKLTGSAKLVSLAIAAHHLPGGSFVVVSKKSIAKAAGMSIGTVSRALPIILASKEWTAEHPFYEVPTIYTPNLELLEVGADEFLEELHYEHMRRTERLTYW